MKPYKIAAAVLVFLMLVVSAYRYLIIGDNRTAFELCGSIILFAIVAALYMPGKDDENDNDFFNHNNF